MRSSAVKICCLLFYLFCVFFVGNVSGQSKNDRPNAPAVAKVFYDPFEASMLVGIRMTEIEERSSFKIQIITGTPTSFNPSGEHPLLRKLKKMLTATRGSVPLEDGAIKLKLKSPDDTFFVDFHGRVLREKTSELFQLSVNQRAEIGHSIENLSGVVDMLAVQFVEPNMSKK